MLGYWENPNDAKFDPPGSGTINKRRVRPVIARYLDPRSGRSAFGRSASPLGRMLGALLVDTGNRHSIAWSTSGTRTSAW